MGQFGTLLVRGSLAFAGLLGALPAASGATLDCDALAKLKLPHTSITLARKVAPGEFVPPGEKPSDRNAELFRKLPAFCRVVAHSRPSADSNIEIEVWMPISNWNGKFQGEGNGGFAGSIGYGELAGALADGYATAGTDTGHRADGLDANWALGHPEKITDFGYRGVHEMSLQAKAIVQAFYGSEPNKSYFVACSDGGREALMEAQRFPADYDGILAGAPANYWTHLLSAGVELAKLTDNGAYAIPDSKIPAIGSAVLAACDNLDGVKDGILTDPRKCHFDPASIKCKGPDGPGCLTQPQTVLLTRLYAGGKASTGEQIFPGFLPGGEQGEGGWKNWILGETPGHSTGSSFVTGYFRNMVFDDPRWTPEMRSVDEDLRAAEAKTGHALDSTDPDLSAFASRGGKLIIYHGWNDPAISALNSINYFESVNAKMGTESAARFARLYLVPGMQHCIGGPGPSVFGQFSVLSQRDTTSSIYRALEHWVESGVAPGEIHALKMTEDGKRVAMTRPICPFPQLPKYKGSGNTNAVQSFACAAN
jgi:Tannase and feruloyl esterase